MGLVQSPLFRHGQSILTAGLIVGMAVFFIEDELVSNIMLLFAAVEVIVTPQILKRVADQ
ncbi:hypothetical protein [Haloquadratum walsbyi]|uniref:Uncharacterized protein n=1 Tax=Haloquadratum walsbyi J07HQW2 TaxID=1238425 RepID=U1NIG1_9EURY|nr:hypothetical protein [Haloquadratum walsbyi]ERG96980.1 MAG: hypothetical protein J07HQW2_03466 [Haloquadratum walsbyi J07HQW2]